MDIEPAFQDHLEVMVAVATADDGAVDAARVDETLATRPAAADALLANLVAAGLLHVQNDATGRGHAYRLARAPEAIGLDEIAAVAVSAGETMQPAPASKPTAADTGTRLLSAAVQQRARRVLAAFTLADVLSSQGPEIDPDRPHPRAAGERSPRAGAVSAEEDADPARLGITVEQLRRRVDAGDVPVVLDVRAHPDSRWPAPTWAHWVALEDLTGHVPGWPRSTRIVTVCRLGVRSLIAASYLRVRGFTRCDPLIGGLEAWHRSRV